MNPLRPPNEIPHAEQQRRILVFRAALAELPDVAELYEPLRLALAERFLQKDPASDHSPVKDSVTAIHYADAFWADVFWKGLL